MASQHSPEALGNRVSRWVLLASIGSMVLVLTVSVMARSSAEERWSTLSERVGRELQTLHLPDLGVSRRRGPLALTTSWERSWMLRGLMSGPPPALPEPVLRLVYTRRLIHYRFKAVIELDGANPESGWLIAGFEKAKEVVAAAGLELEVVP